MKWKPFDVVALIGLVVLVLVLTNPGIDKLKEYLGKTSGVVTISKRADYFVCSTYDYRNENGDLGTGRIRCAQSLDRAEYLGILGHFFKFEGAYYTR